MKLFSRTIQKFWLAAIIILLVGFAMFMNFHETKAAITNMLNFAGKVTNLNGSEVTDGSYNFIFSLYSSSTGGTALWSETLNSSNLFSATIASYNSGTHTYTYSGATATSTLRIGQHLTNQTTGEAVLITAFDTSANTITVVDSAPAWSAGQVINNRPYVEGGVIDVNLGAVTSLSTVDFNQPLYLEITFNGELMQPRKLITSVAQAYNADMLDGYHSSSFANLSADSTVTGEWTFDNILSIATSSSETVLSITQNGSGDIINLIGNSGQEVFTVTYNGNVGIGTSTPQNKLDIMGDLGIKDQNELRLYELASNGQNYVGFRASSTLTTDLIWTLPTTAGSNGQALMINANGDLEWGSPSSGGVNAGTIGQMAYYAANGSTLSATSTIFLSPSGYVGIGTTTPSGILSIASSTNGSSIFQISQNGRIGINTASPDRTLDVWGSGSGNSAVIRLTTVDGNSMSLMTTNSESILNTGYLNDLYIRTNSNDAIFINGSTQYVGIGTTSPAYRLDVYGNSRIDGNLSLSGTISGATWNGNVIGAAYGGTGQNSSGWSGMARIVGGTWSAINGTANNIAYWSDVNTVAATSTIYLANSGQVGINTAVPDSQLHLSGVNSGSTVTLHVETGAGNSIYLQTTNSESILNTGYQDSLSIRTNGNDAIYIDGITQYVGIGTTTPAYRLDVYGNSRFDGNISISGAITNATWNGNTVGVAYGGTGSTTLSGILKGNGTGGILTAIPGVDYVASLSDLSLTQGYTFVGNSSNVPTATSTIYINPNSYVGIGSTSPLQRFVIQGKNGTDILNIASSTGASQFYITKAGNIGVGTTSPAQQLSLTGSMQLPTTGASQYGVIFKNGNRFIHDFNIGISSSFITIDGQNTFMGINSGNFTMGSTATVNSEASYNTGIGYSALTANTSGYSNTALGHSSLLVNSIGYQNTAIGRLALSSNTSGSNNTVLGYSALGTNVTGTGIVALGANAGSLTAALGNNILSANSVFLGYNTKSSGSGNSNEIVIGYNTNGIGSNSVVLGNDSITTTMLKGKVGIGTSTPLTRLHVVNGALTQRPAMNNADVLVVENNPSYSTAINLLSSFNTSSYIAFSNEASNGAGYIAYLPASYQLQFSASGTIPLTVSGNGNVSVGTSSNPEVPLHVHKGIMTGSRPTWSAYDVALFENSSTNDSIIQIAAASTRISGIGFSDNNYRNVGSILYNHLNNAMTFTASGTQRMIINSSGYVGIGTASPDASLAIQGMAGLPILNIASSTGSSILYIDAQGEVGIGTNNPDTTLTIAATSTQMKLLYTGSAHAASFTVGSDGLFTIESNEPGDVYIDPTSKLGVGTSSPASALTVYGDVLIEGASRYVNFGGVAGSSGYGIRDNSGTLQIKNFGTDWTNVSLVGIGQVGWVPRYYENSTNLQATSSIYISNAGNVGIGDTNPTSQLSLGGDVDMNNHNISEIGVLNIGSIYGYGLRFNNAAASSITWGNDSTHQFGVVNISSVKINTGSLDSGTGVTFGPYGATPTASINSNGTMSLNGYAFIGGGRLTISEVSSRASSSILVQTSQGIPFLEFSTSTGEVYMFVNRDGWLGLNTDTPNTFLHVGSANPDKVGSGENAYIEGSVEIDNILYVDGTATSSIAGNLDLTGTLRVGTDNLYVSSSTGNVGIGTAGPAYVLDVFGNKTTYISRVYNENTSGSSAGLSVRIDGAGSMLTLQAGANNIVDITPTQSSFYNKVVMYGGDASVLPLLIKSTSTATTTPTDGLFSIVSNVNTTDNVVFKVDAGGNYSYDGSASSPAADYAEYFFTNDRNLRSGEVVCVDVSENNAVKRCDRASDGNVMGIVSTQPAIIGNAKSGYANNRSYVVVGMLGQVPAKVSDENGSIRPGDSLTSASLPGYVMRANAGDSTVGVALESFGDQNATTTPTVVSTGEIKVLISRRNKSLTVEMVEDTVTDHIANMEIEDEVQLLITNAVTNLNLDHEIQPIVDEQINQFDQRLSVEFDSYDNRLTTIAASVDSLAARINLVENGISTLSAVQNQINSNISELNEKLILLGANSFDLAMIKVDPNNGLAITDDTYHATGTPSVSVVEIETASTTTKTAFVVNQLGNGDVVDFQADGVSIVNIADNGKVSVVGEMSIDGRLMVCAGSGCGAELDEAVDGTMGDMGVEGKVVAGAFESVCDEGFVWVPGSAKYGTMPGFCVMRDEARIGEDNVPTTELMVEGRPSSPWTNVSQGEAQLACQAMGDNYHLINENEWMTLAENIIRVGDNDIDSNEEGLQLSTGDSTVFTLSNGNRIYNLAGSLSEWTDMIVTRAGLLVPTSDGWQEYYSVTDFKGFNIAPPYFYDSTNGIGRIKIQDNNNALRGFVRGTTSLYDLDLSYPPTQVDANIGFRCAK